MTQTKHLNLTRIHPSNFTWQLWCGGTLLDLGVLHNREEFILAKKNTLRKYAIGYCKAESLACRPKKDCFAVMFQKNSIIFWTHLSSEEMEIFK